MELKYLQEFVTLERIRNYTQAAEVLYTTESTLSRHIRQLEKELGQPLFLRTTRRIDLTSFGIQFLQYAIRLVTVMQECETNLLNKVADYSERLIIGVFGQISHYPQIQDSLNRFAASDPDCVVGTVQGDITQLKEKLLLREYNLSIVRENATHFDDKFDRMPLQEEPLCVVMPKDDPIAQGDSVHVSEIEGRNVTLPSQHMLSYKLFVALCREHGFEPRTRILLKEREFMEDVRMIGSGLTVLSHTMAWRSVDPERQVVRELSPRTCEYVNLLTLKNAKLPEITLHALKCFADAKKARAQRQGTDNFL